jgi:hypothetical protein
MFSNLRTEGGTTNHLLVPASLQVADYQKDLVTIEEISRPARTALRLRAGARLPYFSLRDRVSAAAASGATDLRLSYTRGDRTIAVRGPADDPGLFARPPYLLRKLLAFRALPGRGERNTCRH